MINKRKIGNDYEAKACLFLEQRGLQILEQNFRCRIGEIDIIAKDGPTYVFVEVKFRKNVEEGHPAEAVNNRKQKIISKVADYYRMTKRMGENISCRFDVIAILSEELTWYQNAFDYIK
ncbi:MAG: YraN family protein [Lachnospiraceae bacterium]|nr:YraN family protein [Lachnospiraceae bacterium]